MIPINKVRDLISKHALLEKELSTGEIDKKKFAEKSKEYSDLNDIVNEAKDYSSFESERKELEKIINDNNSDEEMIDADVTTDHNIPINNMTIQTMNERMANWSPRYRYIPLINNFIDQDPLARATNGLINRSFAEDSPKYKYILSENGKSQIEFKKFNKTDFSDQLTCPITQDQFEDDQIIAQLPCQHIFEKEAIMKWVQNENASCPSCRFKLDSVEEEIKKDTTISNTRLTITNLLNFIERREQQREEEDIQRAIMASLNDIEGSDF